VELQATRHKIARLLDAGAINGSVLDAVFVGDRFCPAEGVLFDYKRDVPTGAALVKTLRHIAGFHNTYGGYLIIGVAEMAKDADIRPWHHALDDLDSKQVRDLVRSHLSSPIELQCLKLPLETQSGKFEIVLVYIPRRTHHEPVSFTRTVSDEKGKAVFREGDVFFRDGDNTIPAQRTAHWQIIYGTRVNPYGEQVTRLSVSSVLENNLPDRSVICSEFIGRQETLDSLWKWLGDDFSCVKVLAGEGGLGKTSIAYQFSQDLCKTTSSGFEQVVWLSAKQRQFKALANKYEALPVARFDSAKDLFGQLYCHLGGLESELEELSDSNTPRRIRNMAATIRSFIIIDDLDSLTPDDQKRAIEVCQQMAGSGSRFLFTTRKNTTASTTSAIEIKGFETDEFRAFVKSWLAKLQLRQISAHQLDVLNNTSRGSPLYAESIIRLLKSGMSFNDAIKEWKEKLGSDVRLAALEREVKQLTHESRKVLASAAIYRECSYAELKQATEFSAQTLNDCIQELQSLFLIHAPSIAKESRFRVPETTLRLIVHLGDDLITNYRSFAERVKKIRYESSKVAKSSPSSVVGAAIRQTIAQLRDSRPEDALETLNEVNSKFDGKNPDLVSMKGWVLMRMIPPRIGEARKAFCLSYDLGQRKEKVFKNWLEAEIAADSLDAAIEVCGKAIANDVGDRREWYEMRAKIRLSSSKAQETGGDRDHAILQLQAAAEDLVQATRRPKHGDAKSSGRPELKELLLIAHDELWRLVSINANDIPSWIKAVDFVNQAISRGDNRADNYERLSDSLLRLSRASHNSRHERSDRTINLIVQNIRRANAVFVQAPAEIQEVPTFQDARKAIKSLVTEYQL